MTTVAEQATQAAVKKEPTPVTQVTMSDGRIVAFPGKRRLNKDVLIGENSVAVRFDFVNGETRTFTVSPSNILQCAGHGASQKIGDECAGETEIEDMVLAVDDMIARLDKGEWNAARKSTSDGFAGASIVIRAIMEASGKDQATVKAFLQGKLDKATAAGQKLSRKELYDSFRNPSSKTGAIIARLEREKLSQGAKVNADDALNELG